MWTEKVYSRLLIDSHITDIDPSFMAKFDPKEYVRMVKLSGVESSMVYACCHNGNCYYPTNVGHMHANLKGRDVFGEIVDLMNRNDILPIAYHTVVFDNRSVFDHPEWSVRNVHGSTCGGRYRYSCPNHKGYVEYAKAQLSEIIAYSVAGIFIDMTFWPEICVCDQCRSRFEAETGHEIPEIVDWSEPVWVAFQRCRERWMGEFAQILTDHIKSEKPDMTVTHQFSPMLHGWYLGQSSAIARASDYSSGDFYSGKRQQRFATKAFAAFTQTFPYEFMTSRCVDLHDHTSTKSDEELFIGAATTLANGGAYMMIDAINPDGTLSEKFYKRLGSVVNQLRPFCEAAERHVPRPLADCGLYLSMGSCVDEKYTGRDLRELGLSNSNMSIRENRTLDEVLETSEILSQMKIPYKVIVDSTADLSGLKTLIINNAAYLSQAEAERIRNFIRAGGTLIATGMTSFYDDSGKTSGDFHLADVFGVSCAGGKSAQVNYLQLMSDPDTLVSANTASPLVKTETAEVLASMVNPHYPCNDPDQYASIHSNPPGMVTEFAALSVNQYGKGKCVYLASSLLTLPQASQQDFAKALFAEYIPATVLESKNLPGCVELTILESTKTDAKLICLVNFQDELPNIPLHDVEVKLRFPNSDRIAGIKSVEDGNSISYTVESGAVAFKIGLLKDIAMLEVAMN